MAEQLSLTLPLSSRSSKPPPPTMAAFTAYSRILPAASRARVSLAYSPSSSSASLSSLKCLGSSPLVSHLFLNQVQSPFLIICSFLFWLSMRNCLWSLFLFRINFQKRSPVARDVSERGLSAAATPICAASDPDQLRSAREDIKELLKTKFCHPILVLFCICALICFVRSSFSCWIKCIDCWSWTSSLSISMCFRS